MLLARWRWICAIEERSAVSFPVFCLDVLKYASRYQYYVLLGALLEVLNILWVVLCAGALMHYQKKKSSLSRDITLNQGVVTSSHLS